MPDKSEIEIRASLIEEAEKRLHEFIFARIPKGDSLILFLSMISKSATFEIPTAAVAMTKSGAVLFYNPSFILSLSDQELMFVTAHEFVHLASDTFLRSQFMKEAFMFSTKDFNTKVAPYFDVVVNDMLTQMPGFTTLAERLPLIYSEAPDLQPFFRNIKTLEKIADVAYNHLDEIIPIDTGEIEFVAANSDASDSEAEDVRDLLREAVLGGDSSSIPGSISNAISKNLGESSVSKQKRAKALWEQLTTNIKVTRAAALQKKRSMRRINRRTLLPPGRVAEKSFSVLFLLDESGSVADRFVKFAFDMVEHAALSTKADKLYVAHWDTSLIKLEEVKKGKKPDLKREAAGGTEFEEIYTLPEIRALGVDMCIVVTDGETYSWPTGTPPYPTIWVINETHGMTLWEKHCRSGRAMYIPKEFME